MNTCIACRHWLLRGKNSNGEYITNELIKMPSTTYAN